MRILAIDTSCDDTCISLLKIEKSKLEILGEAVSSQVKIHKKYGGVFPFLAKREHQKNLLPVLKKVLKKAKFLKKEKSSPEINQNFLKKFLSRDPILLNETKLFLENYKNPNIDLIAVTQGPGLEPCLWTGINFAKTIAFYWQKPIIPINHLEGHIFAILPKIFPPSLNFKIKNIKKMFPALALIVSGGHTELILIKNIGKYQLLGETLDDAAGECLDKVAKMLKLSYPGGPLIERLAKKGNPNAYKFPRPMIGSKDYNFSFSGLKTAILYSIKKLSPKKINLSKKDIAASAQEAVIDTLIKKTIKATKEKKPKTLIVGGGVSANQRLKLKFKKEIQKEKLKINLIFPPKEYSTDNAVMIAITAFLNKKNKIKPTEKNLLKIVAKPNLNF